MTQRDYLWAWCVLAPFVIAGVALLAFGFWWDATEPLPSFVGNGKHSAISPSLQWTTTNATSGHGVVVCWDNPGETMTCADYKRLDPGAEP